ncbi:MAG: SpoIID/LytB domain-containing protein [Candidatus Andersenbacteria bacterium]
MKKAFSILFIIVGSLTIVTVADGATLHEQVVPAFVSVYGRQPTAAEKAWWEGRVDRQEKTTYQALVGAMAYQREHAGSSPLAGGLPAGIADDKQTMIKAVLPLFVNIYGNDPTAAEKVWWRKRISCGDITKYKNLVSSMQYHKAKNVRKGSDSICGVKAAAVASSPGGVSRRTVAGISTHPMGDEVRIGIFKTDGRAIHVTANGSFQVREGRTKILATVDKDDVVQVSWSDEKYHVRGSGLNLDPVSEVRLVPLAGAIMQITSYSDPSPTITGKNYNRFRGVIEIRKCNGCNELWAINELRTEYYLRGLAETSGQGPEEYIKALGTVARTYVLYHKVITGGRFVRQRFDIDNTANDQLYRGYEYELITSRMASIFNKTKGVIVTNGEGDKPVVTVYFSDSDGRTRSAQEQWNSSRFPHLQSVKDPRHASSTCRGHCVGMSAQGAYGLAGQDKWSFQKILKYFYKGVSLVKAY